MKTVITETGSQYRIDEDRGRWQKNSGPWETIWWAYGVALENLRECKTWDEVGRVPERPIEPGNRLYIGARDIWWLSTEIVEVTDDGSDE